MLSIQHIPSSTLIINFFFYKLLSDWSSEQILIVDCLWLWTRWIIYLLLVCLNRNYYWTGDLHNRINAQRGSLFSEDQVNNWLYFSLNFRNFELHSVLLINFWYWWPRFVFTKFKQNDIWGVLVIHVILSNKSNIEVFRLTLSTIFSLNVQGIPFCTRNSKEFH